MRPLLQGLGDRPTTHRRGEMIRREGDRSRALYLHLSGWIASSLVLRTGKRLIQKVHLPGDMLGTPSMAMDSAVDALHAVTEAVTSYVPYTRIGDLYVQHPRIAAMFTVAVQMERLALMDALAATGNASAREQMARMLLDLHQRLSPLGLVEDDSFELPLTQEFMGDLLGLTSVHVNRVIRGLEEEGVIARSGHRIKLVDLPALQRLSPVPARQPRFEPEWLPARR